MSSAFDWIQLHFHIVIYILIFLMCVNPKKMYEMWKLYQILDRRELLPDRIANFQTHLTSMESYLESKAKIDVFISEVLRGNSCQLKVNSNDLNNLYLQGNNINKYNQNIVSDPFSQLFKYVNRYYFFQITENNILKKRIDYLSLNGLNGIFTEFIETKFITKDSLVLTNSLVVEQNNKEMGSKKDWAVESYQAISSNDFLLYGLFTNDFEMLSYRENEQQRKIVTSIVSEITSIKIVDCYLIIAVK
jgi:hypothetical protein